MKKIGIFSIAAGLLLAFRSAYGQGSIDLNNFDSNAGLILDTRAGGLVMQTGVSSYTPAPAGTVVEILGGASPGSLSPLASASAVNFGVTMYTLTAGDVGSMGPGEGSGFDYGFAPVTGVAANGTGFFEVIAWLQGNGSANTFAAAQYRFQTAIFTSTVGSVIVPPAPPSPGLLNIPQAPEPGTIALGGLGAAALWLFRRRQ